MNRFRETKASHHGGSARLATVFLTSDCNLNCSYCYARENIFGPEEVWDRSNLSGLMDILAERGYRVSIGGGEPLTHPGLVMMAAQAAADRKIPLSLLTNGWLLNEDILKDCLKNGIRWIQISADDPADVERIAPAIVSGKRLGIRMAVGTVLMPNRTADIRQMHDMIAKAGATGWRILRFTPLQETGDGTGFTNEEWIRLLLVLEKSISPLDSPLQIRYEPSVVPLSWFMSQQPEDRLDICGGRKGRRLFLYPDGEVFACGLPRRKGRNVGNLKTGRDELILWLDRLPERQELPGLSRYPGGGIPDIYCRNDCRGGCLQMGTKNSCDFRCDPDKGLVPLCCFEKLLLTPGAHAPGRVIPPSAVYRELQEFGY